jgi:hypothetical protein
MNEQYKLTMKRGFRPKHEILDVLYAATHRANEDVIVNAYVDANTTNSEVPILAVDCVYYEGVMSYITKCLQESPNCVAYVTVNIYNDNAGEYALGGGEGTFTVSDSKAVTVYMAGNSAPYEH